MWLWDQLTEALAAFMVSGFLLTILSTATVEASRHGRMWFKRTRLLNFPGCQVKCWAGMQKVPGTLKVCVFSPAGPSCLLAVFPGSRSAARSC